MPGVEVETAQLMEDLIGDLTAVPQPIEVKLYSDNAALLLNDRPGRSQDAIGKVRGVTEAKSGVVLAGDGLDVRVDPARAELEGVSADEVAKQLEDQLSGAVATQVQSGVNLVNVRVWTPPAARSRVDQVGALMLKSPDDGHLFALSRIADIRSVTGQAEIDHENMRRWTPSPPASSRPRRRLDRQGGRADHRTPGFPAAPASPSRWAASSPSSSRPSATSRWCSPPRWRRCSCCCSSSTRAFASPASSW